MRRRQPTTLRGTIARGALTGVSVWTGFAAWIVYTGASSIPVGG